MKSYLTSFLSKLIWHNNIYERILNYLHSIIFIFNYSIKESFLGNIVIKNGLNVWKKLEQRLGKAESILLAQ